MVLLYLQTNGHEWVERQAISTNLRIHRDGTFVIDFPDGLSRIWTYYDTADKKHWLSFGSGQIQHRFLLQDNLLPAWHGNRRRSLPDRIHASVEDLMQAVDELQE